VSQGIEALRAHYFTDLHPGGELILTVHADGKTPQDAFEKSLTLLVRSSYLKDFIQDKLECWI
jgi:hypothetical protein